MYVVLGIVLGVALVFVFFVPVIPFVAHVCTANASPNYESLSFLIFNIGMVYYSGSFQWMSEGFTSNCV